MYVAWVRRSFPDSERPLVSHGRFMGRGLLRDFFSTKEVAFYDEKGQKR